MARKNYSGEFRRRAVDLYESTSGATLKGIAVDLGISRGALKEWVDTLGSGMIAAGGSTASTAGWPESQSARIVRLETELSTSQSEKRKLETERDILRQTARPRAGRQPCVWGTKDHRGSQ